MPKLSRKRKFDLVIVFLGDNDVVNPHKDEYADMRSNLWGTNDTFFRHLTPIKKATNAKVMWLLICIICCLRHMSNKKTNKHSLI